jgi:lipopolysaccharide transport system permease protein
MNIFKENIKILKEPFEVIFKNKNLILEMTRRELTDRYAGQVFGLQWAVVHPVFIMGLFVFIFAVVFQQKIGGTLDLPLDYTAYLLSGLVSWLCFQEAMVKGCTSITANRTLVKQVVFPIEILPVKTVLSCLFTLLVSVSVLVIYVLLSYGSLHLTYLLLPFLILMQLMMMIGLAYILATIGAVFRDIKDIVQLFAVMGAYIAPVFYLPAWVPAIFKPILYINPFSYFIWCYQDVLYFGRFEHPIAWILMIIFSLVTFSFGYKVFCKGRPFLGNVL